MASGTFRQQRGGPKGEAGFAAGPPPDNWQLTGWVDLYYTCFRVSAGHGSAGKELMVALKVNNREAVEVGLRRLDANTLGRLAVNATSCPTIDAFVE